MRPTQAASAPDLSWVEQIRGDLVSAVAKTAEVVRRPSLSVRDVHRARRLMKDGDALALLLADVVGPPAEQAAQTLRGLRRRLSAARDLDVIGEALERFAPELSPDAAAAQRLRLAARREGSGAATHIDGATLADDLNALAGEIGGWGVADAGVDGLLDALTRSYRKARRRGAVAFASLAPDDLHGLRKAAIAHRGQLAAFAQIWPRLIHGWCAEAQRLRDALGELNDLSLLAEFVRFPTPEADAGSLLGLIEAARSSGLERAEPAFRRLFCERPKYAARRWKAWLAYPKRPLGSAGDSGPTEPPA